MHGRLKVKEKAEIELEKKKKYQEKANRFKYGLDLCLKAKAKNDYNAEVMRISWDLVAMNPDVYSIWNMRKEYIMNKKDEFDKQLELRKSLKENVLKDEQTLDDVKNDDEKSSDVMKEETPNETKEDQKKPVTEDELIEQFQKLCNDELELTEYALLKNSKSYSAWQHRLWILAIIPKPNFKREFQLNEAYLQKDGRNLHCWHYRTNLCNISGRDIQDEINFSMERIKDNLSAFSYSTLYYRSLTLTKASNSGLIDFSKCWSDEYSLIENALFTEPNDQALWFYLRWLLLINFGQCLSLEESKSNETNLVKIIFNNQLKLLMFYFDKVVKKFPYQLIQLNSATIRNEELNSVKHRPSKLWFVHLNEESLDEVRLDELRLKLAKSNSYHFWTNNELKEIRPKMEIRSEQLESLLTLRQLEPDNKWLNLILSYFENTDQLQILDDLIRLDSLRTNYYEDQKSKIRLEKIISSLDLNESSFNLANQRLTVLYTPEPFSHLNELNLSGNQIRCLSTNLNCLVSLQHLIVDDNQLDKIERNFTLPNLHTLSLRNNKLTNHSGIHHLNNCPKLKLVHLSGNRLTDEDLNVLVKNGIHCD